MRVIIRKWGNSASVRIPAAIMEAAHLTLNMPVEVIEEKGLVIITPERLPEWDLDQLLAEITPDNLHDSIDFGDPVGQERL